MQTVTNLNDSGTGSLRAAVGAAAVGEQVVFQSGLSGTIGITGVAIPITQDITITGPGSGSINVSRASGSGPLFDITSGVNSISGLTISSGAGTNGGNLANQGTTTISNCIFQNGSAINGGGIFNQSSLTLNSCTIQSNQCFGTGTQYGAGIYNDSGGTLILNSCNLNSNSMNGPSDARGGAIYNLGTTTLNLCSVTNNSVVGAPAVGGGLYNEGTMTVNQSTVDQNFATGNANSAAGLGGGIGSQFGTLTVEYSTVSNSGATGYGGGTAGGDGQGGAVWSASGNSTYINSSTLSNNSSTGGNGSSTNGVTQGGALWMDGTCAVQANNSTIYKNSTGVWITHGSFFTPFDTILIGSTVGVDIDGTPGYFAFTSGGHNIFGTQNVPYNIAPTGDRIFDDPSLVMLGLLANNGGPTETHALLPGSPAIDTGDNTNAPPTDQRGFTRIVNGIIDIGAYEAVPPPTIENCLIVTPLSFRGITKDIANANAQAALDAFVTEALANGSLLCSTGGFTNLSDTFNKYCAVVGGNQYTGPYICTSVNAGVFTSTLSQADADAMARYAAETHMIHMNAGPCCSFPGDIGDGIWSKGKADASTFPGNTVYTNTVCSFTWNDATASGTANVTMSPAPGNGASRAPSVSFNLEFCNSWPVYNVMVSVTYDYSPTVAPTGASINVFHNLDAATQSHTLIAGTNTFNFTAWAVNNGVDNIRIQVSITGGDAANAFVNVTSITVTPLTPPTYYTPTCDVISSVPVPFNYALRPANDDFANAINLGSSATGSFSFNTTYATVEPLENLFVGGVILDRTGWYSWTAPANGTLTLNPAGSTLLDDPVIGIYTGTALGNLVVVNGSNSGLSFNTTVTAGTKYWLQIGGYNAEQGIANIAWSFS